MSVLKYAISGVSCSGKTTLAASVLARLRSQGVDVVGVTQLHRISPFSILRFETSREAHMWAVHNLVAQELATGLREGAEVVLSDRSVLDYAATMIAQFGECPSYFLFELCSTYSKIFILDPLPYKAEMGRMNEDLRNRAYRQYIGGAGAKTMLNTNFMGSVAISGQEIEDAIFSEIVAEVGKVKIEKQGVDND